MSNFFNKASSANVTPTGLRVTQQAAPPANDTVDATYPNFPLNIASVGELYTSRNSTWSGTLQHKIWANRATGGHNTKDNGCQTAIQNTSGVDCRMRFSTIAKANAATACRLSYSAGYAQFETDGVSGWGDIAATTSLSVVPWSTANANPNTYFTGSASTWVYSTDLVVLPRTRLCDMLTGGKEFAVDYEPQDSRTATDTSTLITKLVALAHGKDYTLTFYTNPLDGTGGTPYNGLTSANFDSILSAVDYFNILIYSGSPSGDVSTSFSTQLAKFTSPPLSKLQVTLGLDCTAVDAVAIRTLMSGFAGVEFWPNGATMGGDCSTNSVVINEIAALTGLTGC